MKGDSNHLADFLERGNASSRRDEQRDEHLPTGDGEYLAFGRRSNKPELTLHFVTPDGTIRSFQYAHLDSASSFTGERIILRFMGLSPTQVSIHGRNLRDLYDFIHQHRITWVRESPRGFAEDGEPIVTRLAIELVKDDVADADEN